jgi:hypothetical protein
VAKKQIAGVTGVLGSLISDSNTLVDQPEDETSLDEVASASTPTTADLASKEKVRARLGRPPGRINSAPIAKEKLTVRIEARLAAAYRDWSWEARCQLGELVEQALNEYLARRKL